MKKYYAKYLPAIGAKPFKVDEKTERNNKQYDTYKTKRGTCIYLGKGKSIKATLFLCSTEYKKGDEVLKIEFGSKENIFKKLTLDEKIKDELIKAVSNKKNVKRSEVDGWTVKDNGYLFNKDIGIMHFKVIAQISQGAVWVKEYNLYNDENCFFDESDIRIMGEHRGVYDDGSYNLCVIKCPTCENLH